MKNQFLKILLLPLVMVFSGCNSEDNQEASENFRLLNDQQLAYLGEFETDDEIFDEFIEKEKGRASKGNGQGICASLEDVEVLVMKIKEKADISPETEEKLRENLTRACQKKLEAQARGGKPDGVGGGKPDGVGKNGTNNDELE